MVELHPIKVKFILFSLSSYFSVSHGWPDCEKSLKKTFQSSAVLHTKMKPSPTYWKDWFNFPKRMTEIEILHIATMLQPGSTPAKNSTQLNTQNLFAKTIICCKLLPVMNSDKVWWLVTCKYLNTISPSWLYNFKNKIGFMPTMITLWLGPIKPDVNTAVGEFRKIVFPVNAMRWITVVKAAERETGGIMQEIVQRNLKKTEKILNIFSHKNQEGES